MVRGLRKQYGEVTAVDGLALTIRRGEVFGLLGPNGAGKSTTVDILQGHRERDGGEVSVLGADPSTGDRAWRSRVGIVWQDESAPAELTVRETVEHFARYYPAPRDPAEVIALVGLEHKRDQRVKGLSGGQRRRLDVALGVIGDPELLLLDEPTTGFDPAARRQFWELIRLLAGAGTTIVLTTHYLEEAEALADRLAVIARGRVVAEGDPAGLRARFGTGATVGWTGVDGSPHSLRTENPTGAVAELASHFGGEVPDLTVTRPTLEDVYLRLTGQLTEPDSRTGPSPGWRPLLCALVPQNLLAPVSSRPPGTCAPPTTPPPLSPWPSPTTAAACCPCRCSATTPSSCGRLRQAQRSTMSSLSSAEARTARH